MRPGRLDYKIEFPHSTEEERARIMQIHSRKMNVYRDVNFKELACFTDDFNGAQLKDVCVEASMLALQRDAIEGIDVPKIMLSLFKFVKRSSLHARFRRGVDVNSYQKRGGVRLREKNECDSRLRGKERMSAMLSSDATFSMEMFPFGHCPKGNGDVSSKKTNEDRDDELDNVKTDEQSRDEVYGYLKGGSGNSGGKRLAISMVEEA
ncbi:26S proteasome regulatory subunit 6A [Tanacetum coccineum]